MGKWPVRTPRKPSSPRARNHVQSIGGAFARSLGLETARAGTINYTEVVSNLLSLERQYVAQLEEHPEFARELRRRIAEKLLEQAIFHGCKLSVCRARLTAASRLGFTDIEQSAHYRLLYAKGAFARGYKQIAYRTARAIVKDLERSLEKRRSLLGRHLLTLTREYLNHIKKSESG